MLGVYSSFAEGFVVSPEAQVYGLDSLGLLGMESSMSDPEDIQSTPVQDWPFHSSPLTLDFPRPVPEPVSRGA